MKLGEMLVRDGRLTGDQLEQSIAQQRASGGRLGTIMVELGFIDLDTLTVFLGVELSTPIATRAALEKAKKRAVSILKPDEAAHYRCVPLLIHERQVIAAIDDPHDIESLDELLRITGYRVVPRVAPEIRIGKYLERYYGIECEPRFAQISDSPQTAHEKATALPARPLPGLPRISENPIMAPTPAPPLRRAESEGVSSAPSNIQDKSDSQDKSDIQDKEVETETKKEKEEEAQEEDSFDEIELEAADLLFELENDEEDEAPAVPADSFADEQASTVVAPAPSHEEYHPVSVAETIASIEDASGRNDIAKALMAHASGIFEVAALCIVRDHMAFGWKVHGEDLTRKRIEALLLPLDKPSMFERAIGSDQKSFAGAPYPATLHKYLFKVLCCRQPQFAFVRAICIGNRTVNVFYGHRSEGESMKDEDLEGMQEVCGAAKNAYVRMITST